MEREQGREQRVAELLILPKKLSFYQSYDVMVRVTTRFKLMYEQNTQFLIISAYSSTESTVLSNHNGDLKL